MVYQENASSLAARVNKTDAREIEVYYKQYYEKYVMALDQGEKADRYTHRSFYFIMFMDEKMSKRFL